MQAVLNRVIVGEFCDERASAQELSSIDKRLRLMSDSARLRKNNSFRFFSARASIVERELASNCPASVRHNE